jgi:predicted ATPase
MIKNFEVKNFKAIESAKVKLTPLTAFIGYNGMGKSSLLEALQMFKAIVTEGLDTSVRPWREFEHIYFKGIKKKRKFLKDGVELQFAPMEFAFSLGTYKNYLISNSKFSTSIGQELNGSSRLFFIEEKYKDKDFEVIRDADNNREVNFQGVEKRKETKIPFKSLDHSVLSELPDFRRYVESWQFLSMNTFLMGEPHSQKKTGGAITLNTDGRNIAEYILSIREKDLEVYKGILETLQYVLPYAKDLQPQITQELEKMVYLQLSEQDFKLPGWMLSTGTLKILALLAVFRHPEPSPLIIIEELENGLDPRTIHLVITEIKNYINNNKGQVLITSHSPYLLDQLHISQIVFVERKDEKVSLSRPADDEEVLEWSKKFAPGQLYTQKGFSH